LVGCDNSIELKSVASVNANKLENSENIVTPEDQIAVYSEGFPRAIYKNSGDVVQCKTFLTYASVYCHFS